MEYRSTAFAAAIGAALALALPSGVRADDAKPAAPAAGDKPLEVKLVDQLNTTFGHAPGYRANHAKGVVLEGTFKPAPTAAKLSSAVHLQKQSTPITVRFSNAGGVPTLPDNHPSALTRGMAIKFHLPDGSETDIVSISLKGFPVATGEDFLALLTAIAKSPPGTPKPTPVEQFVGAHPATAKIVSIPQPVPESYASLPYYGVNAFKFTNADGKSQLGRYRIEPVGGSHFLTEAQAAKMAPNALQDEIVKRVAKGPVKLKLLVQLAQPGDPTNDATQIWPDNRPTVVLGEIDITKAVPDSKEAENQLLFLPTNLTKGIDELDDPLIDIRTAAYAESFGRRSNGQ